MRCRQLTLRKVDPLIFPTPNGSNDSFFHTSTEPTKHLSSYTLHFKSSPNHSPLPSQSGPTISPWIPSTMPQRDFQFCGTFSGKGDVSAARWLKKLEWEFNPLKVNDEVPAKPFLEAVYLLMTGDAAVWTEANRSAAQLLSKENPTREDVIKFKTLLQNRFPAKTCEPESINFDRERSELHQQPEKSLLACSNRTSDKLVPHLPNGNSHKQSSNSPLRTSVSFREREKLAASIISSNSNRQAIDLSRGQNSKHGSRDMTLSDGNYPHLKDIETPARDPGDELKNPSTHGVGRPASPYTLNPPIDFDGLSWPSEL